MNFGKWMQAQNAAHPDGHDLPDDVYLSEDGVYMVECCKCGQWVEMVCDITDHTPFAYYCNSGVTFCQP